MIKVTARILGIEYIEVDVTTVSNVAEPVSKKSKGEDQPSPLEQIKSKSLTGRFPLLETPEGFTIFESSSIAKYLARQRPVFYGNNDFETASID